MRYMKCMRKNTAQPVSGMVDVGKKPVTLRTAKAMARVQFGKMSFQILQTQGSPKGDVLTTAKIAGIMAAKRTAEVIPLCHPLSLDKVSVSLALCPKKLSVEITSEIRSHGRTGVEMEALHAVSVAALTVYDMMKWADKQLAITKIQLLQKTGGQSGDFKRDAD